MRVPLTIAVILILVVAGVGAILITGSRPSGVTKTTAESTTTGGTSSGSLEQSTGAQVTSITVATNSSEPTNQTSIVSENEADNRSLGILGPSLASTLNSSSGLRLDLQLAAVPPHNITITVDDFNTLRQVNNVTAANGWRIPFGGSPTVFGCGPPPYVPAYFAVFQGNLGVNNFTEAESLLLTPPQPIPECPYVTPAPYYDFSAHSDTANESEYQNIPNLAGVRNETISYSISIAGYWTTVGGTPVEPTGQFSAFPQGIYTVVAGDEWGTLEVAHFTVS